MSIENSLTEAEIQDARDASPEIVRRYGNLSMGELLSETDQLYSKITANNNLMSKIESVTEDLENISTAVNMEGGLSDFSRATLAKTHKCITGNDFMLDRMVALESVDGADDDFKDGLVQEIQEKTLNDFLVSLKRTFYDNWGDTKKWYSKVVAVRETVRKKNVDTKDRAIQIKGDPKTTEFIFKDNIDVDNNGKVSNQELTIGLERMLEYTESRLTVKVDKEYEDFIVSCQRMVDGYKTKTEVDESELLKYKDLYSPPPDVPVVPLKDKDVVAKLTDGDGVDIVATKGFPGRAYVVMGSPSDKSSATPFSFIDDTWVRLYVEEPTGSKDSIRVRTFYPNQIVTVCDLVDSLIDSLGYYDKSWERRDRFMSKVFSSLDKTISAISDKLTDSTQDQKTADKLRSLVRVMIKSIQLDNTFNAMLINHVIKTTAQINDLNSACLLQYSED